MRKLIVAAVVLLVLLVGADVGGRLIAQREISKAIERQLTVGEPVSTRIHGFSFLWQALQGNYDALTLTVNRLEVPQIRNADVAIDLRDITLPLSDALSGNTDNLAAATGTARVVISAADLSAAAGGRALTLAPAADGAIAVTTTAEVLGQTVGITATVDASVVDDVLTLRVEGLGAGADGPALPSDLTASLNGDLSLSVPLAGLPFPITGATASVVDGDLVLSAAAADIRAADLR
ncbi:hypothetical protein GCM10009818_33910 [Nakamurella flavida]